MRTALFASLLLMLATGCATGRGAASSQPPPEKKFSMRTYYMAFLKRGPAWTKERTPEAVEAGKGHMAHIERMARCGKLVIAGPFDVPADAPADAVAGIFIFDVATREEALALTAHDPAVKAGRFSIEVLPWYGPTGLTYEGHIPPEPGLSCTP